MTSDPQGSGSPEAREDASPGEPAFPATPASTDLPPEEEPTTTGTLFIMILFLMALAGMWGIMYFTLLGR